MSILHLLTGHPYQLNLRASLGMLVFRIMMGSAFILHGMPKMQAMTTWMDGMGMGIPPMMQAIAAIAEFGGGIALILGVLTPLATLGLIGTMIGALMMVHIPAGHPFVSMGGPSLEPAMGYLCASAMMFLTGPGQYSLDAVVQKNSMSHSTPAMSS